MRLILLGAPGSGKGTQAELLEKEYGCIHVSTGDILRQNMRNKTHLGSQAEAYMKSGSLVPDDIVVEMLLHRLRDQDLQKGFLLDGFPRTIPQAEALETSLHGFKWNLDAVLLLLIDEELLVERLTNRRTCRSCGKIFNLLTMDENVSGALRGTSCPACSGELFQRDDDKDSVIRNRLRVYQQQTAPLISWYGNKGLLKSVDACRTPEDTFLEIRKVLD